MTRIVGISGSLRQGSFNSALLRAAMATMPDGATLAIASIVAIPLYNGDVEAQGIPPAVAALKDAIAGADGVLLATPEYNAGIPGVFKNALDWASRPPQDIARVFGGRPFAIVGASPGMFGTIQAQTAWWPVLRNVGARPWFEGRLMVPRAGDAIDAQGNLTDAALRTRLKTFLADYVAFVRLQRGAATK